MLALLRWIAVHLFKVAVFLFVVVALIVGIVVWQINDRTAPWDPPATSEVRP